MSTLAAEELKRLQESFFGHLLGKKTDAVNSIQSTKDRTASQRLHIYASGYRLRLKEAITTDFDCLFSYLGDDLFEQLMDTYIDRYQSTHSSLRFYSQHMIQLMENTEPFSLYPEIIELARIEQAFNFSFDAANGDIVALDRLALIKAENWETLRVNFHPSLQLLDLKTNSFFIWKALADEEIPPCLVNNKGVWLVWRRELVSRYKAISDAEACVLRLAMNGHNFAHMCEALNDYYEEEQSPLQMITFLQGWMQEKMVCDLS